MESPIALVRRVAGTEFRIAALIGEVERKIPISAMKMKTKKSVAVGANMHAKANGAPSALEIAQTRRYAHVFPSPSSDFAAARSPRIPPIAVATKPETT